MFRRHHAALSIAFVAVLVPLSASAQTRPPPQPPPEARALMLEMRRIQTELLPIQEQALQDSALRREQEEVSGAVRDAMIAADPANGERMDRMDQIMAEARAAQQSGDTAKISQLAMEAAQLQPVIEEAQAEALAQPEIEARLASFQGNLKAKMIEIEPKAREQIERLEALNRRLQEVMGKAG